MKRFPAFVLALLLALGCASSALAGIVPGSNLVRLLIEEEQVEFTLMDWEQFTLVTPENMEEHMDLLTMRGETEEQARFRFQYGNILLEAYNLAQFPYGVVRVQVFEDELTHAYWDLTDNTFYQVQDLTEELGGSLFQGYMRLFNIRQSSNNSPGVYGSVIWYPPFEYESGLFSVSIHNGKMYMISYLQRTPGSNQNFYMEYVGHLEDELGHPIDEMIYTYLNRLPVNSAPSFILTGEAQTPMTDLRSDPGRLVLNAHSGPFTFTGITESGAQVTIASGDAIWQAAVDDDNAFSCAITLSPGNNLITVTASKAGLQDNAITGMMTANDAMAALELTEYPFGAEIRTDLRVAGRASPGAEVFMQIDDQLPVSIPVQADGQFDYPFTVEEDWVDHDLLITAREAGLSDCSARFTFSAVYGDAQRDMYYYRQTVEPELTAEDILSDPGAYVGSRVGLDVSLFRVHRGGGMISCEARINDDPEKNIILLIPDYMDDEITPGMFITVYGELDEPTLTEPPLPRMNVAYVYNFTLGYR